MYTPKGLTAHVLDTTRVNASYEQQRADTIFFALMRTYAPDVLVELEWPQSFPNPVLTIHFRGSTLRAAIEQILIATRVMYTITDYGALRVARPVHSERMKHAVVIEPDNRTWQKVELPNNGPRSTRSD